MTLSDVVDKFDIKGREIFHFFVELEKSSFLITHEHYKTFKASTKSLKIFLLNAENS